MLTHHTGATLCGCGVQASAWAGFRLAEIVKHCIGLAAVLIEWVPGWLPFVGYSLACSPAQRALWQLALLEAVVSVPGYVEALVRLHLCTGSCRLSSFAECFACCLQRFVALSAGNSRTFHSLDFSAPET